MLNRERVLTVFRQVLDQMKESGEMGKVRPRAVAVRAHEIYCAGLGIEEKKPALVTFRKFVSGKSALPEVLELLNEAEVRPATRVRLNRGHLYQAFRQAVESLQSRILMGRARPLDVARKAYEIYSRSLNDVDPRPSHLTFQSLVYDKETDEEIQSLLVTIRR